MSDKLKPGIGVNIDFSGGEQPTGPKLSAITSQMEQAADQLEHAVGDPWGQSFPYSVTAPAVSMCLPWGRKGFSDAALANAAERQLDIVNLSRLIGPASNLNPRATIDNTITEALTVAHFPAGVHEFTLMYPSDPTVTIDNLYPTFSGDTAGAFTTWVATPEEIAAALEYSVVRDANGTTRVYCYTAPTDTTTVTYDTSPVTYAGGAGYQGGSFNVIPDPNQIEAGGAGCVVAPISGTTYSVTLPVCTHAQSNYARGASAAFDIARVVALSVADVNTGVQLYLPAVLNDNFAVGDTIPQGFLYLKNVTDNVVYKDATYTWQSSTVVYITGVDLTQDLDDGDAFAIITVGTDITTTLDDLRWKLWNHSHDGAYGSRGVEADDITKWAKTNGDSGSWTKSDIPGNYASQYLHRDGWYTDTGDDLTGTAWDVNANDENCMRGHFVLGYERQEAVGPPHPRLATDAGKYLSTAGGPYSSFKLYFGDPQTVLQNALIYKDSSHVLQVYSLGGYNFQTSQATFGDGINGPETSTTVSGFTAANHDNLKVYVVSGADLDMDAAEAAGVDSFDVSDALDTHTVVNFSIMIEDAVNGDWYHPSGLAGASYGYTARWDETTDKVVISNIGAGWNNVALASVGIRMVFWYV